MSDAFFSAAGNGRRFRGDEACVGPWSPEFMHGGPPSALLVRACEGAAQEAVPGLVGLRASLDFLSAVPVGDVEISARVVRAGRRITLTEAILRAGDREVMHARVWHLRTSPTPELPTERQNASWPSPADAPPTMTDWTFPYARAFDWRVAGGDPERPGPAAAWSRARIPVVPGEEPTGLQRAVLSGDSGNGLSAALDWNAWSFVNIDLDVHLSRPLVGPWVLLDASTRYESTGTALASSLIGDEQGPVGRGAQTLLVSPRGRP